MIVIYGDWTEIVGGVGRGFTKMLSITFTRDGDVESVVGRPDKRTVVLRILPTMSHCYVVHWTILKVQVFKMKGGLIAPGFECHISHARYNNTLPPASFSIYLLYRLFHGKCFVL